MPNAKKAHGPMAQSLSIEPPGSKIHQEKYYAPVAHNQGLDPNQIGIAEDPQEVDKDSGAQSNVLQHQQISPDHTLQRLLEAYATQPSPELEEQVILMQQAEQEELEEARLRSGKYRPMNHPMSLQRTIGKESLQTELPSFLEFPVTQLAVSGRLDNDHQQEEPNQNKIAQPPKIHKYPQVDNTGWYLEESDDQDDEPESDEGSKSVIVF